MPIVRDGDSLIVQHRPSDPTYLDGGDSCMRTSMNGLTGSVIDILCLHDFVKSTGEVVRHPKQEVYSDTRTTTRDQTLPLIAAMNNHRVYKPFLKRIFYSHLKRGFLGQNVLNQDLSTKPWYSGRDINHPGHAMLMAKAANLKLWYYLLFIPGMICMLGELLFTTKIRPWRESNQAIAMFDIAGVWWLKAYTKLHPNWKKPLEDYWGGYPFRDTKEIGDNIIKYVLTKISK